MQKNNYIRLSVVTTLILTIVLTAIFLIAFLLLDSKISKYYGGDNTDYVKLMKKLIFIICVIILLFSVFKGYTGLSRVKNYAVINFFNNGYYILVYK